MKLEILIDKIKEYDKLEEQIVAAFNKRYHNKLHNCKTVDEYKKLRQSILSELTITGKLPGIIEIEMLFALEKTMRRETLLKGN